MADWKRTGLWRVPQGRRRGKTAKTVQSLRQKDREFLSVLDVGHDG